MLRRSFLKGATAAGAVTAAAAGTSAFPKPAIAQGMKELRMVTSWPKGFPGLGTAADRFAGRIERATEGRYTIKVFAGGELVHPLKCNDAVQEGTADLYHSADYYYVGKTPAYNFFTTVPFGLSPNEMDAWIQHGGGQELWDEVGATFGVKHLPCGDTGSQMGGWFNKPMQSLDDFKGLKMRIPGMAGEVIKAMGGTTVTLAGSEILPALQAGTIDATEWVGPWNDLAFGFYKIVKNYHYPGFHEPGPMLSCGISLKIWEAMSESDKEIFTACALAENNHNLAEFNANNSAALATLINEHGVNLVEFPDEVAKAAGEASKDVVASAANHDDLTKRVYESYMAFRKTATSWTRLSDQAYYNKRDLVDYS